MVARRIPLRRHKHFWLFLHAVLVVIDSDGNRLLSQRIPNDEPALLVAHGKTILYIPGRIVHHAARL